MALYSADDYDDDVIIAEFKEINAGWASKNIVLDNKFVFGYCGKYIVLCSFTQRKVAKE